MRTDAYVIHIIDDDAAVRRTLELLVRSAGYPAETYATASAYLAGDPKCTEGCVLLDICMPGMDGLRLLEVLAQSRPTMPVVMMTGHGDVGTAGERSFGKPFESAIRVHRSSRTAGTQA